MLLKNHCKFFRKKRIFPKSSSWSARHHWPNLTRSPWRSPSCSKTTSCNRTATLRMTDTVRSTRYTSTTSTFFCACIFNWSILTADCGHVEKHCRLLRPLKARRGIDCQQRQQDHLVCHQVCFWTSRVRYNSWRTVFQITLLPKLPVQLASQTNSAIIFELIVEYLLSL